jgi:hypothetical protein
MKEESKQQEAVVDYKAEYFRLREKKKNGIIIGLVIALVVVAAIAFNYSGSRNESPFLALADGFLESSTGSGLSTWGAAAKQVAAKSAEIRRRERRKKCGEICMSLFNNKEDKSKPLKERLKTQSLLQEQANEYCDYQIDSNTYLISLR